MSEHPDQMNAFFICREKPYIIVFSEHPLAGLSSVTCGELKGYWLTAGLDSAMYRAKMAKREESHYNMLWVVDCGLDLGKLVPKDKVLFGFIVPETSGKNWYCCLEGDFAAIISLLRLFFCLKQENIVSFFFLLEFILSQRTEVCYNCP